MKRVQRVVLFQKYISIMAFYDDRKFVLSHIRHSFITSDDTGMCEAVMINEVVTDKPLYRTRRRPEPSILPEGSEQEYKISGVEELEEPEETAETKILNFFGKFLDSELQEAGQSLDIVSDMALLGAHRHRSNTAQRLERLKREKQIQANIKNIQWKETSSEIDDADLLQLFPKKDLSKPKPNENPPKKSALTEALAQFPETPNNPFSEFTRFDGRISRVAQTKKIMIFLTMLSPDEREYPMEVVSLANARVQDLIGLICWQYTNEGREPKLKPSASNYCLRIAEETGEVDEDFPSLDPKELVAKFGFPVLAMVERENAGNDTPVISMRIEDEFTKLEIPNLDVTLKEVVEEIRKRRKWLKKSTNFHIEKLSDAGIPISLDSKIVDTGCLDFRLVLEESSSKSITVADDWSIQQMALIEAPLYQSYTVLFVPKIGIKYDVQLGISDEKVEINPLPQKGAAKLLSRQQKPTTYFTDSIASCETVAKKYSPGVTVFKIVYQNEQDFKSLLFESDNQTAQQIVRKLQLILGMHFNSVREEYQLYREKKLKRKHQKSSYGFPKSLS